MIQCRKYAPQTSHKAHAKQKRKRAVFFAFYNSIDGYMCLMNKKEEKNSFKCSCIWNWLVCFVSAAQNRVFNHNFQDISRFFLILPLFAVNMTYGRLPFSFIVLFFCLSLVLCLCVYTCVSKLYARIRKIKPQNGLFFFSIFLFQQKKRNHKKFKLKQ